MGLVNGMALVMSMCHSKVKLDRREALGHRRIDGMVCDGVDRHCLWRVAVSSQMSSLHVPEHMRETTRATHISTGSPKSERVGSRSEAHLIKIRALGSLSFGCSPPYV